MKRSMKRDKLQVHGACSITILVLNFAFFSRSSCSQDSSNLQAAVTVQLFLTASHICPLVHTFLCLGPTAGYVQAVSIHPTPSSECSSHLCKPDCSNLPPHTEVWICGRSPPLVEQ